LSTGNTKNNTMSACRLPSIRVWIVRLVCVSSCFFGSFVDESSAQPTYWKDIRPIFRKHCTSCHNARTVRDPDIGGGLALDSYEAVRKGTKRVIVRPGKSSESVLLKRLTTKNENTRMPLSAEPLPAEQITLIRRWIDAGAREGVRPIETPAISLGQSSPRRKRDVLLPTSATAPGGRLALSLQAGPLAPVTAVVFSPDGRLLAAGSYGQVTVWDLAAGRPARVLTNVLGAVNDLRFSPDGTRLAVAGGQPSAKGDLRIYHVSDWRLLAVLRGHEDVVFSISWRPDGNQLASASFDKTIRIWDMESLKWERTFTGHSDVVYTVAYSPDGKKLASASKDRTARLIDPATGKALLTFSGMEQDVLAVAWSGDGRRVVTAGFEPALHWWDAETGKQVQRQSGHGAAVHELAFSKDGTLLVSAGADRTVRLWDGKRGAAQRTLSVGSLVYAVAISPNKKLLASGSFDGLVRLWETASGRHLLTLLTLPAEKKEADWLALTPEGYAAGSPGAIAQGRWRVGPSRAAVARAWEMLRRPEAVVRAIHGEAVPAAVLKK
jgi:hypothetical protein